MNIASLYMLARMQDDPLWRESEWRMEVWTSMVERRRILGPWDVVVVGLGRANGVAADARFLAAL